MFSRKLLLVAVYVFTLVADIKVTSSSKTTPYHGQVNRQQAGVYFPTGPIARPSTAPANGGYPNRDFINYPNSGSHNNDPHRIFHNKQAPNPHYSGTDTSIHHPVVGYPGYLVYKNGPGSTHNPAAGCSQDPSTAEDPQWDSEDPEWDPEDPGWDPEDPEWDPEDPGWDPEDPGWDPAGDPNDPDDSDSSFTDMMSRMAQQVMSLSQGNNPFSGLASDPQLADPGITDFASTAGNTLPNADPGIADFASTTGNTIPNANTGITDFASTTGNTLPNADTGITDFASTAGNTIPNADTGTSIASTADGALPQAQSVAGPTITDFAAYPNDIGPGITQAVTDTDTSDFGEFAADEGNIISSIPSTQQGEASTQLFETSSSTADSEQDIESFDAIEGNNLPQSSDSEDNLTLDSSNIIPVQQTDLKLDQLDDRTKSQFSYIIYVEDDKSLDKNAELSHEESIRQHGNPSFNTYSSNRLQKFNSKVPLQILFKSNMSQGVQIPNNLAKTDNCITPIPENRDGSVSKAIRDSAVKFNRTQNINFNPFLVLTPKNLTRSSLTDTYIETYTTSEEMEALYEEAVSTDQSMKVLFLPDFKLNDEQIQSIVERISLEISKEEGRYIQELVLIPLDMGNNTVTIPSDEVSIPTDTDPFKSTSFPISETTLEVNNLTSSNPQTGQTVTTETNNLYQSIQPIDIPLYPEMTTPCPTPLPDNWYSNFSPSSEASVVDKSSITVNQNQEFVKEDQNCSVQSKNKTEHHTEIFIPCFISIGHESNAFEKKLCEMQENGCITKLLPQHYMFKSKDQDTQVNHGGEISTNSGCFQCPSYVSCSREGIVHSIQSGIPYQAVQPVNNIELSGSSKLNSSQSIWNPMQFEKEETPVSNKGKLSCNEIKTYPYQNNLQSSSTPKDCSSERAPDHQISSVGQIPTGSECFHPPPPCYRAEVVNPVSSGSPYQTSMTNKVGPVDNMGLCGSSGINRPQHIWDSVHFEEKASVTDKENPSCIEITNYTHQNIPEHRKTPVECFADRTSDLSNDSYFNVIKYPITIDQLTKVDHNRINHMKVEPILSPCTCEETYNDYEYGNKDFQDQAKCETVRQPETIPEIPNCPSSKIFIVKIDNIKPINGSCPCSASLLDTICRDENIKNSKDHSCLCKLWSMHQQKKTEKTKPDSNLNKTCSSTGDLTTPQENLGYDMIPTNECEEPHKYTPPLEMMQTSTVCDTKQSIDHSTKCYKNINTDNEIITYSKPAINRDCTCNFGSLIEQHRDDCQRNGEYVWKTYIGKAPLSPICKKTELPKLCSTSDENTFEIPILEPVVPTIKTDRENPSYIEVTTYPHRHIPESSKIAQECVADITPDSSYGSSFKVIEYPITLDQLTKIHHNRLNHEGVGPILNPCTCGETAWNAGTDKNGKCVYAEESNIFDQFKTVSLNRDHTIPNDYCHNQKPNDSAISLDTRQIGYSGASRSALDSIKENAENNQHYVVGKDHISHSTTCTTTLNAIKKNGQINDFTDATDIASTLSQNIQGYDVKHCRENESFQAFSPSDSSNKFGDGYQDFHDQAKCMPIPDTKPEIPKCPSSKVFIVKVDNIKPINGSCPCSASLLNTVCRDENMKNSNSKDQSCLCKLWSMHQQKTTEKAKPDSNLNKTCTSRADSPTPQGTPRYYMIPTNKCEVLDEYNLPLEITQTSSVWDTKQSTYHPTECDKNITKNTEINTKSKSAINRDCQCDSRSLIEQPRDESQRNGEYAWEKCINKAPLPTVCKKIELPKVCPPSDKNTFEIPILEPVVQTFTSDRENPSYIEVTTYPHQHISESSKTPQECVAHKISDLSYGSFPNAIKYPITIDQIGRFNHNKMDHEEVEPTLPTCTCKETAQNAGTDKVEKYGLAEESKVYDPFETVSSNRDQTIPNEYCHNQKSFDSSISLDNHQIGYSGGSRITLDSIKKNAKNNHHIIVEKDYISHSKTGTTNLDTIKKNGKMNGFTDATNIVDTLSQKTQGYDVKQCQEHKSFEEFSLSDSSNKLRDVDQDDRDQEKCIPETKPEIAKCPSSKVFIVKIDNIKPINGSCPCSESLLDTVCRDENMKNTNSKDHNCLCKLWSMHQQKTTENTKPDPNLNETCSSTGDSTTPQENLGYDMIPTNECDKPYKHAPSLEITQTSTVEQSLDHLRKCDENINTNDEINTFLKSPINKDCPCNFGSSIEQQRDGDYAWKTYIHKIPLSPVSQKMEVPSTNKNTFEIPILESDMQTSTSCLPENLPPIRKPIYKQIIPNSPFPKPTKNPQTPQKIPSVDNCPPTVEYGKIKSMNHPIAQSPQAPQLILNITKNPQTPPRTPSLDNCPKPIAYKNLCDIPVPTPPRISHICHQSHDHSTMTPTPEVQSLPTYHKVPQHQICPSTNEHTKKTEIPVSKCNGQAIPTNQHIPIPTEDFTPHPCNKTNRMPIVYHECQKPPTQESPTLPKTPNICPTANVPVNSVELLQPKPITQTQDCVTFTPTIQTPPTYHKVPQPQICPSTDEHTKTTEIPVFKCNDQTIPTNQHIPIPTKDFTPHPCNKTNGMPIVYHQCQKPPTQESLTLPKPPNICPTTNVPVNSVEILQPKPITQTQDCVTYTPTIQTLPTYHKVPQPLICPSTDEHTKKTEIPVSKCNDQAIPTNQHIPAPIKNFSPHLCNKTNGMPIMYCHQCQKPPTQEFLTPPRTPYICSTTTLPKTPNICPTTNAPVKSVGIVEPKPIIQTQNCGSNILENQTKVVNVSQNIEAPNQLKATLDENCLCKLRAILDKHRISSGQTSQTVDQILQKPHGGSSAFPTPQHDPILTNCVPTDEQSKIKEIIPLSASEAKDWNTANNYYNSQVNDGSCKGDMKPTTETDCDKCRERKKELLAKILKEVFVNNLDLLYEDKNPCKPSSGQV